MKSEYFRKALDGEFKEASEQAIDLPEEDPSLFSFVVAYLYEEKFVPIKTISTVLGKFHVGIVRNIPSNVSSVPQQDKGKGKELLDDANSDSEDETYSGSASDER